MNRTRFLFALILGAFALLATACSDPADPCEHADQIIEAPMTGTATGDPSPS